jgi:predicted PurR-regulated permease PerM
MDNQDRGAGRVLLVFSGLLLAYAAGRVLQPFIGALAAAAVIAVAAHPLYARLHARMPARPRTAAALLTAAICLGVAVPLALGGWALEREAERAYPMLKDRFLALATASEAPPSWMPKIAAERLRGLDLKGLAAENVQQIGKWSAQLARSAASNAADIGFNLLVFVGCLYLFLGHGRELLTRLMRRIPLKTSSKARIAARGHDMIVATVEGVFAVAVVQGVLATVGFAIFGVRLPVLLGTMCAVFSPIPFVGTAIVWVPAALALAFQGSPGRAALVALWCVAVVGTSDNVVRPLLVGSRARLPAGVVLVGVLGGLRAFGVVGLFLGPVVVALAAAVVDALLLSPDREEPPA